MDYQVSRKLSYLTYFEAESSNAQFLFHFAFLFFKFWIILSPSCNSFKCTYKESNRKRNFTSLKFYSVVFEIDISTICIVPVPRGV